MGIQNRDDHSKNFSYLMDTNGKWTLSPAYDLTYSSGPNGEQSTTVMGEGKNPSLDSLLKLAVSVSIGNNAAKHIISQCKEALSHWERLATDFNVSSEKVKEISKYLVRGSKC